MKNNLKKDPDIENQALTENFLKSIEQFKDQTAICAPDKKNLKYSGLLEQIRYVKTFLNDNGIGRNDPVAVVLPNGPEMAITFMSVISCATCAPLNPQYREEEYRFYFKDLKAKALILMKDKNEQARKTAFDMDVPVFELIPKDLDKGGFELETESINTRKDSGFSTSTDIALILHTSGTTSLPKMVPLSQKNLFSSSGNISKSLSLNSKDRCLILMPLFHIHGLIACLLSSIHSGGSVICTSGFNEEAFIGLVKEFRPSWYSAVPTIHQSILQLMETREEITDKFSFRLIRSSSSSLPPKIMKKMETVFKVPIIEAYGMTEATHQMASNPLPPEKQKYGSVGLPAGPELKIVDKNNSILPSGEIGEVVIQGNNIMNGYSNNPEANKDAFFDGWFRTGDQGYIDLEGYLFLSGRIKELINRGGEKISPREIDEILMEHPSVSQAVTFAAPHERLGESIMAAVVLKNKSILSEKELRDFASAKLAQYKVPQQIIFLDKIPKGPTGKLQRIGLAEKLVSYLKTEFEPAEGEVEIKIADIWQKTLKIESVSRNDNFFNLGGDSLLATQVISKLKNEMNISLPDVFLFTHPILADAANEVIEYLSKNIADDELEKILKEIENN